MAVVTVLDANCMSILSTAILASWALSVLAMPPVVPSQVKRWRSRSAIETPLSGSSLGVSVKALSCPVSPLSTSREPLLSLTTVAATPDLVLLIADARSASVLAGAVSVTS